MSVAYLSVGPNQDNVSVIHATFQGRIQDFWKEGGGGSSI